MKVTVLLAWEYYIVPAWEYLHTEVIYLCKHLCQLQLDESHCVRRTYSAARLLTPT